MKKLIILSSASLLLLTACGSKEQAEVKLAKGCEAAVRVMLAKPDFTRQVASVKSKSFGTADGFRLVTLNTVTKTKDTGSEADEAFECQFQETQSFNYMHWSADLVQLKIDDVTYGSEDRQLNGSIEDQIAITEAVAAAMK